MRTLYTIASRESHACSCCLYDENHGSVLLITGNARCANTNHINMGPKKKLYSNQGQNCMEEASTAKMRILDKKSHARYLAEIVECVHRVL